MSATGDFLYKTYKKRVDSLLSNLEYSSSGFETNQIHRIRLDIKRIRAIFQLVELLKPEEFSEQLDGQFLKNLFKTAGQIRDLQVNQISLEHLGEKRDIVLPFKEFLIAEEIKYRKHFKYVANRFDRSHLSAITSKISQLENEIPKEQAIDTAIDFINTTTEIIRKLNTGPASTESLHKIRQHLKSVGGIASLISSKRPDEKLKNLINVVKNTGFKLGQWHDHVVLAASLDAFLDLTEQSSGEISLSLRLLSGKMKKESKHWVHVLKPTVQSTIQEIRLYI